VWVKNGAEYLSGFDGLLRIAFQREDVVIYETVEDLSRGAGR